MKNFESFLLVIRKGIDVEIHVVGASGDALEETIEKIVNQVATLMETALTTAEDFDDIAIDRLSNQRYSELAFATGVRATSFLEFSSMVELLRVLNAEFETVLVAK